MFDISREYKFKEILCYWIIKITNIKNQFVIIGLNYSIGPVKIKMAGLAKNRK